MDPAWPTTEAAPATAPAAEQPGTNDVDASVDGNGQSADSAAPAAAGGDEDSEAAAKGANPDWTGHGQSRYNYDDLVAREGEYDGNARVYHWDGDEGDIGPEFPELELEIFGPPDQRGELYGPEIAK